MTIEQRQKIRDHQRQAGVGLDDREYFIEELEPRNGRQEAMKGALLQIIEAVTHPTKEATRTLVLTGREGTGKTFFACSALNTILASQYMSDLSGSSCYVLHRQMDMEYRSAMGSSSRSELDVLAKYVDMNLLVIDEICRSTKSDYSVENLELLIAKRYAMRRPTVLISNATREQLFGDKAKGKSGMFDLHIVDRLRQGLFVELDGPSQRRVE